VAGWHAGDVPPALVASGSGLPGRPMRTPRSVPPVAGAGQLGPVVVWLACTVASGWWLNLLPWPLAAVVSAQQLLVPSPVVLDLCGASATAAIKLVGAVRAGFMHCQVPPIE
jgi:hypothetical protein